MIVPHSSSFLFFLIPHIRNFLADVGNQGDADNRPKRDYPHQYGFLALAQQPHQNEINSKHKSNQSQQSRCKERMFYGSDFVITDNDIFAVNADNGTPAFVVKRYHGSQSVIFSVLDNINLILD